MCFVPRRIKFYFVPTIFLDKCAAQNREVQSRVLGILQVTHLVTNPIRIEVEFWKKKQVALIIEVICIVLAVVGYGFFSPFSFFHSPTRIILIWQSDGRAIFISGF